MRGWVQAQLCRMTEDLAPVNIQSLT